ncbi:MAG: ATP-binding protein [Bacteroidetes bacterium]|nr:MAG: ATP-binding protein [Bacteroidota bacterium]
MITRTASEKVLQLARQFKAVAIMGPRQSGKTTLSRMCFPEKAYISLENPENRDFALSDPAGFLKTYPDGAILDEVQRVPELLSWLQQDIDEDFRRGKFILTGSNNLLLLEKITQTLAGRVAYLDLLPLSTEELTQHPSSLENLNQLLYAGAYPSVQIEGVDAKDWYASYVRTYIERDVRQIRNIENLLAFEKVLALCAGRIGQQLSYSNLSIEAGVDSKTVQSWLGILQASYILHFLPPYFKNFNKRVVKTPKLYFYDTGLACYLLRMQSSEILAQHPLRGAVFENFVLNELMKGKLNRGLRPNLYYWRDSSGHEVDIIADEGNHIIPIEVKSGQTITSDYAKGLKFWEMLTGESGGLIYYGGDGRQDRSDQIRIRSWKALQSQPQF